MTERRRIVCLSVQPRKHRSRQSHTGTAILILLAIFCQRVDARAIDEVRLSKTGSITTIEIELGCAMRYSGHTPANDSAEIRVRLAAGYDCRLALQGVWNELRQPAAGRLANLVAIEFDLGDRIEPTITLRFDSVVSYQIKQTGNLYMLSVEIDTSSAKPPEPMPLTPVTEGPVQPPAATREKVGDRNAARRVRPATAAAGNRFTIRIAELSNSFNQDFDKLKRYDTKLVYTNEIVVGERRWAELRIGFFDTENEARTVLEALLPEYESAWITVANMEEQTRAARAPFKWPDSDLTAGATEKPGTTVKHSVATLTTAQAASMRADARAAFLRREYDESIRIYTLLVEEPGGDHRREARELLGVTREKNGELALARAEYTAYLAEYPGDSDARRVQQRLASISVPAVQASKANDLSRTARESGTQWEVYGGGSQYYLRGVNVAENSEPDFIAQSSLFSQAYLYARRRGKRFDVIGRTNLGYIKDFVENGSGDQGLVSYAYIDVTDTRSDINARIGRQLQQSGGSLGRFDGLHVGYRLRPDLAVHVTAGFPVDSPRYLATTDHNFYGASINLSNFASVWDLRAYTNVQTIDGILDRRAFGAEAQYRRGRLNVVGVLDYDASYNVINTALVTGNWRITNRLTVHGRFRGGAAPFLTTRNAIVGQPVNTVRELFPAYSEGQIRRLARNRTAEERAGAAGLTAALTTRLQLKASFTYADYSQTIASGGVSALPATGPQYSWGGQLIGSGYFRAGNVMITGYRHDETQSVDRDTVWFDLRHPVGENFRIQTRLSVSRRVANQNAAGDIVQWNAQPVLRLLYKWRRRYQVELEVGGQALTREFPAALAPPLTPTAEYESSDYYLQLGYTVDF